MDRPAAIKVPNKRTHYTMQMKFLLSSLMLFSLLGLLASCQPIKSPPAPSQSEDIARPIEDLLQKAFATLPGEMANQDFVGFQHYFATSDQGADVDGINEIYKWIQELRSAGTAPAETAEYKLNQLNLSNVRARSKDATAHVSINMSKVEFGDTPNAEIRVEQDIALVQVNGQWLISGADQAKVTNLLKAPQ